MSDAERTTPTGLFHFAHSYWLSALALQTAKVKATHPDAPISFLYIHAIELYLKSYLRGYGTSEGELRTKYGHRICCLADEARQSGLQLDDEDVEVLSLIVCMDVIELRYIKTGAITRPTHEALNRTCKSLHESIGLTLRDLGFPVRRPSQYVQKVSNSSD